MSQFLVAKYVPDLRRMEARNIGVITWAAGATCARFAAERVDAPGEVDGRSLPGYVTSLSAYKQWIRFWRKELEKPAIRPVGGGPLVSRSSPDFLKVLAASSRGNFVLVESGRILDPVPEDDLPDLLNYLYRLLVEESSPPDEPRDPSLDETCEKLIDETQLAATPLFHRNYPVSWEVGNQAQETFEFSYALANGRLLRLYQQFPLPKRKKTLKRNVHHVAWMFEKVIGGRSITREHSGILVYPTEEQIGDQEIQRSLDVLGSVTRVLNLQDYAAVKREFEALPRLAFTHDSD